MKRFLIATDAFPYLAVLGSLTWWLYFVNIPLAVLTFLLLAFILFFFRNPPRKISMNDNVILSPADGKVMFIDEIDEPEFMGGKAKRVSIFLNVFNVHINRSPIEGTVEYIHYRPGQFIPAFKSHCSDINERNSVGIVGKNTKVLVHQITGFIARRIVCWVKQSDTVMQGQRFGLIKFGSCTEIIMPLTVELKVQPGQTVRGGKTIIGMVNHG